MPWLTLLVRVRTRDVALVLLGSQSGALVSDTKTASAEIIGGNTFGPKNRNEIVAESIFQRSFKIYQPNFQANRNGLK